MQHHAYKGSNFMHRPKRKASIFLGLIVILFSVRAGFSQKRPCTDVEARHASLIREMEGELKAMKDEFHELNVQHIRDELSNG
jgi:hypothetical protein